MQSFYGLIKQGEECMRAMRTVQDNIVIVDKYVCIRVEIDKPVSLCLWVSWPRLMFAVLFRGVPLVRVARQARHRVYTLASRAITLGEALCVGIRRDR